MDDRERLRQRFNRKFAHFEIELPVEAMSPGSVWLIVKRGWTIWTRFDIDAEDGREHLDHYSMHRMTNDSHVRWYADGEEKTCPRWGGPTSPLKVRPPRRRTRRGPGSSRITRRWRGCSKKRASS